MINLRYVALSLDPISSLTKQTATGYLTSRAIAKSHLRRCGRGCRHSHACLRALAAVAEAADRGVLAAAAASQEPVPNLLTEASAQVRRLVEDFEMALT
jgi:hypothetical protein